MTSISTRSAQTLVARAIHDHGLLPMCVVKHGRIAYANAQFTGMFCAKQSLAGTAARDIATPSDSEKLDAALDTALREGTRVHVHFSACRRDGTEFRAHASATRVGDAEAGTVVMTLSDVSAQERSMAELRALAFADVLTGLPNRALFQDRLRITLLQARRQGGMFGIMVADLDGFKEINDRLGHAAGDEVLKTVAGRFGDALRDSDTIARVGGDEFALILPRLGRRDDAALLAGRIIRSVAEPMTARGVPVTLGVSIGIATWPENGDDMDSLCLQADNATYAAKRAGKGRFAFADSPGDLARALSLPVIEWSDRHRVGHADIDREHRHLADIIERVGRSLREAVSTETLDDLFAELISATEGHFSTENALMDACRYAQAERHRNSHRRLLDDLRSLAVTRESQSLVLVTRFLQDWLFAHIETEDRPLATALSAQAAA